MNIKQILMTVLLIALSVVAVAAECTDAQNAAFEKWDHDWGKYNAEGNEAELKEDTCRRLQSHRLFEVR